MMQRLDIYIALLFLLSACSTDSDSTLFTRLNNDFSGVQFQNNLTSTDSLNIIDYLYFYNGGGVAVGDLNNDNLPDIIFTANQSSDKVYINDGNLTFIDVTHSCGIDTSSSWSTGVTIADINGDGWNDFYISKVGNYKRLNARNSLYINQKDGTFIDQAHEFGLDFSGFSTQANFFDFDNDGDLDCYLLNHSVKNPSVFAKAEDIRNTMDPKAGDILFKNEGGVFVNSNKEAGIYSSSVGFGLGITTADFNQDGWQDIYVGNDFHENDYLYINQQNGTFQEVASQVFGHTSNFTMGVAAQDINQDGGIDVFTCDMMPDDEAIFKQSGGWENIEIYNFKRTYGYHHQSPRNTLQVNTSSHILRFTEQACFYNMEATDWSWTPILADFNSNGKTDLFITNGISKRPNDMDFVNYMSDANTNLDTKVLIDKMPDGQVKNRLFLQGNQTFSSTTIGDFSRTTGAAIGDLDNDGDWDIVLNNIDQEAEILINQSNPTQHSSISLFNAQGNPFHQGATVNVYYNNSLLTWNANNATGFQSCNEAKFLIPESHDKIDSITVIYGSKSQALIQKFTSFSSPQIPLFLDRGKPYKASQKNLVIFNESIPTPYINEQTQEKLLPFIYSNPLTSFPYRGNNNYKKSVEEYRTVNNLLQSSQVTASVFEDFNNDGIEDVYMAKREDADALLPARDVYFESAVDSFVQVPVIGEFALKNASVVLSNDYQNDGDQDLFIGIRNSFIEGEKPISSLLKINNGNGRFSPFELDIYGSVSDAIWTDIDGNGEDDLIIVGHWMPITIVYFEEGKYRKEELDQSVGLWNTCELVEIDGAKKLVLGNIGRNHRLNSVKLSLLKADINKNGSEEYLMVYKRNGRLYSYHNFETLSSKYPILRKHYPSHNSFANVSFNDVLSTLGCKQFEIIPLDIQESAMVDLIADFPINPLPIAFQKGMITSIESDNGVLFMGGNSSDFDPNWGRQDGFIPCKAIFENGKLEIVKEYPDVAGSIEDIQINNWGVSFKRKGKATVIKAL